VFNLCREISSELEDVAVGDAGHEDGGVALASAGPTLVVGNTPGVEFEDTFYVGGAVARMAGTELCHLANQSCNAADIEARFNENVDTDDAAGPARFYYGLDPAQKPPNTFDFIDVALHEFGHHWNLGHSISRSSTMFFQTSGFGFGFNPLAMDDLAGVNVTYPMVGLDQVTGSITGRRGFRRPGPRTRSSKASSRS